jgi:hypothetical protein
MLPPSRGAGAGGGLWIIPAETVQQKVKMSMATLSVFRMIFPLWIVEFVGRIARLSGAGWAAFFYIRQKIGEHKERLTSHDFSR